MLQCWSKRFACKSMQGYADPNSRANCPTAPTADGSPSSVAGTFWEISPDQIQLREKIGQGVTAVVYRARLAPEGTLVAVKQINWSKPSAAESQQRAIERELAIMSRVSHDNLVRFIGVMSLQNPFCIVAEFCAGGCLFSFLYNSRGSEDEVDLSWLQVQKMCVDVASAMLYLHAFNPQVVHRDLKSLNLLLLRPVKSSADSPHLKVTDFGLSRMKDKAEWGKMTKDAGTSCWMAPEVVKGTSYDEKVDVYSYSMVLFEILTREIPFEDEDPKNVGRLTVTGARPELEAVPEDCPTALRDLMIRCWSQDPCKRPNFVEILDVVRQLSLPLPP